MAEKKVKEGDRVKDAVPAPQRVSTATTNHVDLITPSPFYEIVELDAKGEEIGNPFVVNQRSYEKTFSGNKRFVVKKNMVARP